LTVRDVLVAMIQAHEIQGCIALENSFNKVGLDHVVLVKVASTAVVARLLGLRATNHQRPLAGLGRRPVAAHLPPRAEHRLAQELGRGRRHQPRRAPGPDARTGEMGYPSVLTAKTWGFYDVVLRRQAVRFQRRATAAT
jgi:2-methylcitrate dehydratase